MHVGEHPCHRKAPFESDRQVGHDAEGDHQQRQCAVVVEFLADLRADEVDALQFEPGVGGRQCGHHAVAGLCGAAGALVGQADQDVMAGAEGLHRHFRQAGFFQHRPDGRQIGGLAGAHFHDGTAREVDAQIQALVPQRPDRKEKGEQRNRRRHLPPAHEGDVLLEWEKFQHGVALRWRLWPAAPGGHR